jgi:hypothetical protein
VSGLMPGGSGSSRHQRVGEAAEQVGLGTSCRKSETDAACGLNDAGSDFQQPQPEYTLPGVDAPAHCGEGVEGYYAPFATAALAAKLKRAGGELQYIAMDEPLFFGHYYNEKNACRSSIRNVVDRVAANLREYQKIFPDAVLHDHRHQLGT